MSKKEKENLEAEEAVQDEATKEAEAEKTADENTADKELADTKDQLLRITAEYANFRKRSEKEKQDAYAFAKSETIKELLPVIDNLERALASESEDYESLKKGVELTFNNLVNTLGKLGVEIFGTPGDEFDPNLHNAVMHIEDENYKNGEIVDVFQKGYKINDKIIRPAMVKSAN
ncbi:MAG: nucleotide exchange factor GrpE [Eubacterium sp.]|nr:nucleotide exchange factor GrpE [Eubacterium sp.]